MSDFKLAMHYIRKNKGMIFSVIIQVVICTFLIGFLYQNFSRQKYSLDELEKYVPNQNVFAFYADLTERPDLQEQLYQKSNVKRYNKLYLSLLNENKYKMYTINDQCTYIYGQYNIPKKCWDLGGQQITNNVIVTDVKTMQFNKNNFTTANIKIREGRKFSKKDYNLQKNEPIPVILGDSYKDTFKIGDTFKTEYFLDHISEYKVIGFLNPNSVMIRYASLEYLDNFMIIPAFNNLDRVTHIDNDNLEGILRLQIDAGAFTDLNMKQLEADLNKKVLMSGCNEFYNNMKASSCIAMPNELALSRKSTTLLIFIAIMFTLFITIEMSIFINRQIQKNHRLYAVCFISGADTDNVKASMMYLVVIIGFITAFIYTVLFVANLIFWVIPPFDPTVGIYLIMLIMIVSLVYPMIKINKYSVAELMKRR